MSASEGRATRARSKEVDSAPASPNKRSAKPRRGRSASVEQQQAMEFPPNTTMYQAPGLPTVAESPEETRLRTSLGAGASDIPYDIPPQNIPPNPFQQQFTTASADVVKSAFSKARQNPKKRGGRQQGAPATAPTAVMTSDQAQTAQLALSANQQLPTDAPQQIDPQLQSAGADAQRRSLLDRQDDAQRVPFDESQATAYGQAMQPGMEMPDMAATQDGGFQTDNRDLGSAPQQRRQRAPRRQPPQTPSHYEDPSQQEESPPSPRPPPTASNYAQIQQAAKLFTAGLRKDNVPQKRKAWTPEECDALIEGIGVFGNAYATLKSDDAKHRKILLDRSAEDLRHKARNMKFDYLKAQVDPPEGFQQVLLDKKFQDKLANMGIPYVQSQVRQGKRQKTRHVEEPEQSQEVDQPSQEVAA